MHHNATDNVTGRLYSCRSTPVIISSDNFTMDKNSPFNHIDIYSIWHDKFANDYRQNTVAIQTAVARSSLSQHLLALMLLVC